MLLVTSIICLMLASDSPMENSLIIMSAPEKEGYYSSVYEDIINFHIGFAKAIIEGQDEVLILTDSDSHSLYEAELGNDVLVKNKIQADIWMRDFTTVNPTSPVQFKYAPAAQAGDESAAIYVQSVFNEKVLSGLQSAEGLWELKRTDLVLDGGNFVDNHVNRVIVSEKILEDSVTTDRDAVKQQIKELIPMISEVAIIPYDDPNLGHADGMLMWVDENTLFVNNMTATPGFRNVVLDELTNSFPGVTIVEVPSNYTEGTEFDKKFSSALGININTVMTRNYLYVPTFGNTATDREFLAILSQHTTKDIRQIAAAAVAPMGGSCRCLTWQTSGAFAKDVRKFLKPNSDNDDGNDRVEGNPTNIPSSAPSSVVTYSSVVATLFAFLL